MRPSKYNFTVNLPSGGLIVYNTLFGSLTVLDKHERKPAEELLQGTASHGRKRVSLTAIGEQLLAQRHLIEDDLDELAELHARKAAGIEDPNRLDLILLPTLNCNFSCTYCYEDHRNELMTQETERRLCRWMARNLAAYKLVMLHWFGGEPLIRTDQLLRITSYAKSLATGCDQLLIPHVTTNGYLLNPRTVDRLVSGGIYSFQVTMDGPAETHDRLRVLRSGGPTWDRVYAGVVRLVRSSDKIKVSLRINFNHTNIDAVPALLQHFPQDVRSQLRVVLEPVFGTFDQSAMVNLAPEVIGDQLASHYRTAEALGYDITFSNNTIRPGRLVYCYAEREHQLIVAPNGDIFKCSVTRFEGNDRVGYLDEDGQLVKDATAWRRWVEKPASFPEPCSDCVFLPLCMGGCRKLRHTSTSTRACSLAPTNASYILKQVAFGRLDQAVESMI